MTRVKLLLISILGLLYLSLALLCFFSIPIEYIEIYKEVTKDFTIGFLGWLTSDSFPDNT